jgi:hypothetical protein
MQMEWGRGVEILGNGALNWLEVYTMRVAGVPKELGRRTCHLH